MIAATAATPQIAPRREAHEPPEARGLARDEVRMLVAARRDEQLSHARAHDLPAFLRAGDLLVVNTSATLPAALPARRGERGAGTALRLHLSTPVASEAARWTVELRRGGERLRGGRAGETLALPAGGRATLRAPYLGSARLWVADLDSGDVPFESYLAEHGAPIRYGYVAHDFPLADYQTIFAREPGSAEMPSAGRPFTARLVADLVAAGIALAQLTLHTGVSSLDAGEAPYPERFAVPAATTRRVDLTRRRGGRVIAVGTTVVRALETAARGSASGWTHHFVTPETGVRAVDGLLTGWHEPEASHLLMLEAIGGADLVAASYAEAARAGYLWHEFGDVHLILP